jgi:hypothetical protein
MLRALRLTWDRIREDNPDMPEWCQYLEGLKAKSALRNWRSDLDLAVWKIEDDEDRDYFGPDAELISKARAFLDVLLSPHKLKVE